MTDLAVSGLASIREPRSAGGQYTDYLTPLESSFCAEVAIASAGMTRAEANELAKKVIPLYEDKLERPPKGKSFLECYDKDTLEPSNEWLGIYKKVKNDLIKIGYPLEED